MNNTREDFSIKRIVVVLMFALVVINNIKIPPHSVPVVTVSHLDVDAKALPFVILVKDSNPRQSILAHERCHIRQYNHYGSMWMLLLNTYYSHTYSYINNPLEKQAFNFTGFCAPEREVNA